MWYVYSYDKAVKNVDCPFRYKSMCSAISNSNDPCVRQHCPHAVETGTKPIFDLGDMTGGGGD